jgi:hypothetical protein
VRASDFSVNRIAFPLFAVAALLGIAFVIGLWQRKPNPASIQTESPALTAPPTPAPAESELPHPLATVKSNEILAAPPPDSETLTAAQIEEVVARNRVAVKRKCWEPYASTDGGSTQARVTVSFTIAPNGSVQNLSSSGETPGVPKLAGCVADSVKRWQFPRARLATNVNVPFVFVSSN